MGKGGSCPLTMLDGHWGMGKGKKTKHANTNIGIRIIKIIFPISDSKLHLLILTPVFSDQGNNLRSG